MIYFANPTSSPAVHAAMASGELGMIDTPRQGTATIKAELLEEGVTWCADNGCFSDKWDEATWWAWLQRRAPYVNTCAFAVAPDVVCDHDATLELLGPWGPRIRALGYPVAFVLQNGATLETVPWDRFDVLFVGGDDAFKLGPLAATIVREAVELGYPVHLGRANSGKRVAYAAHLGCASVDGTFLVFAPDHNLGRLRRWFANLEESPSLF